MLGAIIGDTVGSAYEFNNKRSKDFDLFTKHSELTDDSIMSLAVCECLLNGFSNDKEKIVQTLKKWGHAYPDRGYGGRFYNWLFSNNNKPYNSFGNGAAMRISSAGWFGRNEEEVKELAQNLTAVTHNHPEGIKGAEVTAMCVYYARIGKSKEFIKEYVSKYYNLDFDYEDLKKNYWFNETCQDSVPQAIYCFLISTDFEDCLRTTISIGGDCDTTSAISCAIAEAYYKYIDPKLATEVIKRIPESKGGCKPLDILIRFLSHKAFYNSEDEEISDKSYVLTQEFISEKKRWIEFISSKSLQAIAESFIYFQLDYHIDAGEDQSSDMFIAEMDLEHYFGELRVCFGRDEPFVMIEKIVRSMLECNEFETFSELIRNLNSLINQVYSQSEYTSKIQIFENANKAYKYLTDNYAVEKDIYKELFAKTYENVKS